MQGGFVRIEKIEDLLDPVRSESVVRELMAIFSDEMKEVQEVLGYLRRQGVPQEDFDAYIRSYQDLRTRLEGISEAVRTF